MALRYPGNTPSNVAKDAKYSLRTGPSGGMEVQLVYRLNARERALLTTDRHEALVEQVNAVKRELTGQAGGSFYVNEYFDVIVPDGEGGGFYAGTYEQLLVFDFEGTVISPVPPPDVRPGDVWKGPHVGIRYKLHAGASDISYETKAGRIATTHALSDHVGSSAARSLARRLAAVKGDQGGRIYLNEAGHFFAPLTDSEGLSYRYLGHLEDDPWFPPPEVPGR